MTREVTTSDVLGWLAWLGGLFTLGVVPVLRVVWGLTFFWER